MTKKDNNPREKADATQVLLDHIDKAELVSDLSHELRTLLGGIIGINELLLGSELNTHQRQLSQTIEHSSRSLLTVLNDVVDLSRIESGKLKMDLLPMDLQKICNEAVAQNHDLRRAGEGINFSLKTKDLPMLVLGDSTRTRQVVAMLISRAVTAVGNGRVTLSVTAAAADEAELVPLRFEAQCEPVSEQEFLSLGTLNQPEARGYKYDSRWLSLFLCHRLAYLMNGRCGAERTASGCHLWILVPFKKQSIGERETTCSGPN